MLMTAFDLDEQQWHGFDIIGAPGKKGFCELYHCRVTHGHEHAFDFEGQVIIRDALEAALGEELKQVSAKELALKRVRAIIDLRKFEPDETIERSLYAACEAEGEGLSEQNLRRRLLEVFYTIRLELPQSYMKEQVDVDGLCMELGISETRYVSAVDYLLGKGWLERWLKELENYSQLFITTDGMDEHEAEDEILRVDEAIPEQPDFSFITDPELRSIIERDYQEVPRCLAAEAYKAATVMCGSVMEALLLDALLADEAKARQSSDAPKDKAGKAIKDLGRWRLSNMIDVAVDLRIIPSSGLGFMSGAVREHRNLIHPAVEIRKQITPERTVANAARAALDLIINNLA